MVSVTWFDFYDCQSVVQLAAAINLALTVGVALREPYAMAFGHAADRAAERIAELKSTIATSHNAPLDTTRVRIATALAEAGEQSIQRCRFKIEGQATNWRRSDDRIFRLAVLWSLVSILLLFVAAGPHKAFEVDVSRLAYIMRVKHVRYQVTMLVCASLYIPLMMSLIGFLRTRISIRRGEVELIREVAEVREGVRLALLSHPPGLAASTATP